MVIAQQMDEAVDEQYFDLPDERVPRFPGLTFGPRNGDDDVPEDVRPQIAEDPLAE